MDKLREADKASPSYAGMNRNVIHRDTRELGWLPRHTRGRIEIISVGLYSTLWSDRLLNAYADGIRYVLEHNTELIP